MASQEDKKASKAEQLVLEEFIRDLEHTATQVEELLKEIQGSKVDFVQIKTELKFLVENVKQLSAIIRGDSDGSSVITRLALLEQSISEIKQYINKDAEDDVAIITRVALLEQQINGLSNQAKPSEEKVKKSDADIEGKWKLYVTIAAGIFTLLGSIIALVTSILT